MNFRTITDPGVDFQLSSQSRQGLTPRQALTQIPLPLYLQHARRAWLAYTRRRTRLRRARQPPRPSSPITTEYHQLVSLRHFISGSLTACCLAEFDASRTRRPQAGDGLSRRAAQHSGRSISVVIAPQGGRAACYQMALVMARPARWGRVGAPVGVVECGLKPAVFVALLSAPRSHAETAVALGVG